MPVLRAPTSGWSGLAPDGEKRGVRRDEPVTWPEAYGIDEYIDVPTVHAGFTERLAEAI